ncbi:hypothetical protein PR048_015973 [Dryococelus australis]|uniref:Uncharacterized protein n=1 Tax=Dryococelus australis TaxID=614101 RepID=A0ABQ9HIF5_9NEOP|nr:hypothetical protein PR048_015973 [Dryococelus australis]
MFQVYDEQNMYLFGLMSINQIKQRRHRQDVNHAKFRNSVYSYIVSVSDAPNNKFGKYEHVHCKKPPHVKQAVKEHTSSFKGTASHYSIGASKKLYLPPELNVKKMHLIYKEKHLPSVNLINTNFNITFGFPRSHAYSTCDTFKKETCVLEERLKSASNKEHKNILLSEEKKLGVKNYVHKSKAETFYARKRHANIRSRNHTDYDGFQNITLSMPNISTNDVYYKRQLPVFTFKIRILSSNESYFYCYDETIGWKGTDEVVFMLYHFISTQLNQEIKRFEIFCDSCCGQNKNYTAIRYLHYVVHSTRRLDSIQVIFSVRSHSYLKCGRNIALIQLKTPSQLKTSYLIP